MMQKTRLFLLVETVAFASASLVHSGFLIPGYEHAQARIAEGLIAAVLFTGLLVSLAIQEWTHLSGMAAQSFALLGTLVGLFTIAIGVGPRTVPDLTFHATIVVVLVWGLIVARRAPSFASRRRG